jgi:hypothetical protein
MDVSRRAVLGAALASPLLVSATMAPAAEASTATATSEGGWFELVWTPLAQATIDQLGTLEAVAPVQAIERDGRRGLRFPVSAQGDPSPTSPAHAQLTGASDGGFLLRNASTQLRITQLRGDIRNEELSARYMLNDVDSGMQPMFTWRSAEGDFSVVPGAAGGPVQLRMANLPVRMTSALLDLIAASARSYGLPDLTTETVVGHLTAQGRFTTP